jgi:recombination protein RecA
MAEERQKTFFEKLNDNIQKNVKGVHASIMAQSDIAKVSDWIKTPSYDLNRILSGDLNKGIPNRSLVGVVGPEHTMKSSFMVLCMAEAQKQGYKPIIIDTERGAETEFCKRWGLDTDKTFYTYTPWDDDIRSILAQIKETGEKRLIIGIDSMGGIDRYKVYTDALKGDPKADQGLLQKNMRTILKLLLNICIEQEAIGIVTGHMYGSPGLIPMPDQIGGGKAMRLFPSILISLKKTALKDADGHITGNEIKATTIKNRMYPPFQTATVSIDYNKGIDPYAGILDLLMAADLVKREKNTFFYKEEKIGVGEGQTSSNIHNHPTALGELNEWLKKSGYSSLDQAVAVAETQLEALVVEETEAVEPATRRGRPRKS